MILQNFHFTKFSKYIKSVFYSCIRIFFLVFAKYLIYIYIYFTLLQKCITGSIIWQKTLLFLFAFFLSFLVQYILGVSFFWFFSSWRISRKYHCREYFFLICKTETIVYSWCVITRTFFSYMWLYLREEGDSRHKDCTSWFFLRDERASTASGHYVFKGWDCWHGCRPCLYASLFRHHFSEGRFRL